jgi:hypothetical protein
MNEISTITPPKQSRYAMGPTQLSIQWAPAFYPGGQNGRGVTLTTHLRLVPRLIKHGAIPLLPLYAFMAWTRTSLHGVLALKTTTLTLCMEKEKFN